MNKFESKLNNYFKVIPLDLNYFMKNGFWMGLVILIDFIFGFALSYSIANFMNQTTAGKFFFFLSLLALFSNFSLNGFTILATNEFLKKDYSLYLKLPKIQIISSLLGTLILFFMAIYSYLQNQSIWYLFLLIGIILPLNNFTIYIKKLYSEKKFQKLSLLLNLKSIIYYTITIYAIIYINKLFLILIIFFGLQIIMDIIYYIIELKKINIKNKKLTKKQLKQGFLFSINSIIKVVSNNFDKILLPLFFDLRLLAIYSISLILPKTLTNLFDQFSFYMFYDKIKKRTFLELKNKIILFGIILSVGSVMLYLIIPKVFSLFFKQYMESVFYAQLLILLLPLNFLNLLFTKFNESKEKPQNLIKISTSTQIIFILLYVILIPTFNIFGIIIARYVREILSIIINLYYIKFL